MEKEPELMSYEEAAAYLGLLKGTLYALVHKRQVPHVRLGPRFVRFRRSDLDRWLLDRSVPELPVQRRGKR